MSPSLELSQAALALRQSPIPALLAVAGLHHHLVRQGTRTKMGLILESGEPREVHHFAALISYGAYRAFFAHGVLIPEGVVKVDPVSVQPLK